MSDLSPGQEVTVSGASGGPHEVVYVRGDSVRIRSITTGACRTVKLSRVTPKRESKALSVLHEPIDPSDVNLLAARAEDARGTHEWHFSSRPCPKPVTLYSEPYLAYVRNHPCCRCGTDQGVVPHHWSHHGASTSKKTDDYRTVPLCDPCHMGEWHAHGTFPGMSREASEALMLRVQRELLLAWTATRIDDGDMVDALIRAIGGQS